MTDVEPCPSCDFIGPQPAPEQFASELHRALHQAWRSLQPVIQAFRDITIAADNTESKVDGLLLSPDRATLVDGTTYEITTQRDEHLTAQWAPRDGITANHPWLGVDNETRYREDYIVHARPAPTGGNDL